MQQRNLLSDVLIPHIGHEFDEEKLSNKQFPAVKYISENCTMSVTTLLSWYFSELHFSKNIKLQQWKFPSIWLKIIWSRNQNTNDSTY